MRTIRPSVLATLVIIGLGAAQGCATRSSPTPLPYRGAAIEDALISLDQAAAREDVDLRAAPATDDVLYATDRQPRVQNGVVTGYTSDRGLTMRFGVASARWGKPGATIAQVLERMARNDRPDLVVTGLTEIGESWRTIPSSDPRFLGVLEEPAIDDPVREPERRFVQALNERLTGPKRVLLYVPGFNTSFEAPVRYAAEFSFYLESRAVPVAFSWPAKSTPLGYSKQVTTAGVSVRALRELIEIIATESDAQQIDILSYSAGAPVVSDALHQLRLMRSGQSAEQIRRELKIGTVIYAGADEDLDRFRNLYLDGFADVAERIVLYSSARDFGLTLSKIFVRGSQRLGTVGGKLSEAERQLLAQAEAPTQVIDVAYAQQRAGGGDIFSHGYWYGNPWVSSDVIAQLRYGLTPEQRGLIRDEDTAGNPVWRFPSDYSDRILSIFSEQARR